MSQSVYGYMDYKKLPKFKKCCASHLFQWWWDATSTPVCQGRLPFSGQQHQRSHFSQVWAQIAADTIRQSILCVSITPRMLGKRFFLQCSMSGKKSSRTTRTPNLLCFSRQRVVAPMLTPFQVCNLCLLPSIPQNVTPRYKMISPATATPATRKPTITLVFKLK